MASSSSENNKIVLKSSDGAFFEVDEKVARELQVVADMIDGDCADKPIPLANVTGNVLSKVIEFCKKHVEEGGALIEEDEEKKKALRTWDLNFMKNHGIDMIFQLVIAADFLNNKGLHDLTCQTVADHIKDKSPKEVREIFGIENDYTPEEAAEIRKVNAWAFE